MNSHLENKRIFSEAEKDAIIEEILQEKPWEGLLKGKVALFLRKRTLTLYCLITAITMFNISKDINQPHIEWVAFAIAVAGFLWDTFITSQSYDLNMTDREWVTLAVKGGYLGDKNLIENKNFFTRNLLLWIPMLCLTGIITYFLVFLKMNTNDIWYLCIAFLLYPMFYSTGTWKEKLHPERSVLNDGRGYHIDSGNARNLFMDYDRTVFAWIVPIILLVMLYALNFGMVKPIFLISWYNLPIWLWIVLYLALLACFIQHINGYYYSFKLGALSSYIQLIYILGENGYANNK